MDQFVASVLDNKEWLFSGLGVVVIVGLWRFLRNRNGDSRSQTIRSGDHSTNVQAGHDVNIPVKTGGDDKEKS